MLSGCKYYSLPDGDKNLEIYYSEIAQKNFTDNSLLKNLKFVPYKQQKINFVVEGSTVIFKVNLKNQATINTEQVLVIGHKYLDQVSYLTQDEQGDFTKPQNQFRLEPSPSRIFSSERFVFNYQSQNIKNHYIVVQNRKSSPLSISLIDKDSYIIHDKNLVIFFTLLYSSLLGLFLVNFIYYFYIKNKSYIWFSFYMLSGLMTFYWQESRMIDLPSLYFPVLGKNTGLFAFLVSNLLLFIFFYSFLKLNYRKQVFGKWIFGWILYLMVLIIVIVFSHFLELNLNYMSYLYNSTVHIGNLLVLFIAYKEYRQGNRQAGFLLVAWIVFLVFSSFRLSYAFNIQPNQFWMQHSYEVGMAAVAFILALGLADQALGYKKSRDKFQNSFDKAQKALFAESLVGNFLHEIKEEIFKETKVQSFIKHIESYFAQMILKYAPIENVTKLSLDVDLCHKLILVQQSDIYHADVFFENYKVEIFQACDSNQSLVKMVKAEEIKNNSTLRKVQIIVIPVLLDYNFDKSDNECLILEVTEGKKLNSDEIRDLKTFIDKAIKALMESQQLQQITKHAKNIISQADKKDKVMRLKDRFFANVSHEFRTPLTLTIAPLKDLHKQRGFLNTSGKYLVDTALSNAQDLLHLVDKILDIQKLEAQTFPLRITKVNLNELIYSVIKKLINWSLDHYQTLIFEKSNDQDVYVYCDKREIKKVIVNLISNAIKYSGKDSKIIVSLLEDKDSVKIKISDDGVGIGEDIQEQIFERYFQGNSPEHLSEAGTGIGLSYVKDVMELHHGRVTLSSNPSQGSTFTLCFKQDFKHFEYDELRDSEEKSVLQKENSELISIEEAKPLHDNVDKTTILIVEDNPELIKFLVFKFKDYYKVLEAENGRVGLDMAIKHLPDLIISDVMMPEMDGMELLSHLRNNKELKTVPIVLLTAMSANVDAIEGLGTGADDYVTKPFDFDELKARVDRLIASRKAIRDESILLQTNEINNKSSFQEKLDETIHGNISDSNLNVETLAELMYLDRSGLYRKTKAELNMSPVSYIRQVRMEFAMDLLTHKKLSVSETAYACGFDSLSYFSKQFKKTYGTSPSDVL